MKKFFPLLFTACLTLVFTWQCDTIDQPFNNGGTTDTTAQQQRNVLIEDFTGHRCKNCPKASKQIDTLVATFGEDRIIGLAIHAGPNNFTAVTTDYPTDLTTQEGRDVQSFFGTNFLPCGMINREGWTATGNTHIRTYQSWPTLSAEAMDSTLKVELSATATVAGGNLVVNTTATPLTNLLHDLDLVVLVKESGIVSPQLLPDNSRDADYIHKNVLRDYVTPITGVEIGSSPILANSAISHADTLAWNTSWVQSNAKVVVYVFNPENNRILQVIQREID